MNATKSFIQDLAEVINRHSAEKGSNTPDFILAEYLYDCLIIFDTASRAREEWYGTPQTPAMQAAQEKSCEGCKYESNTVMQCDYCMRQKDDRYERRES